MRRTGILAAACSFFMFAAVTATGQNQGLVLVNGTDAHVDVPDSPTLTPPSGITVEAWVTYDGSTLGSGYRWPTIVRKNPTAQGETYLLRIGAAATKNTNIEWKVVTTSGSVLASHKFTAGALKTWTHIAATFDGTTARIFVNGLAAGSNALSSPGKLIDDSGVLRIGNGDTKVPGAETWNGRIDEVRIWPVARTRADILANMKREIGFIPGEVSTWNLNGNGKDSSGANSGTPTKNATFSALALKLTPSIFGAALHGTATAGCSGLPLALTASYPQVGNSYFSVHCIRATSTGAGFLAIAPIRLSNPIVVLGCNAWVSPIGAAFLPVNGGAAGTVRTPIPIPNAGILAGQTLYLQYFWTESGCKVPLFASNALALTIQK